MMQCGGVPEWPKGADCKSATKVSVVRIHLPPPIRGYGIVVITSAFQAEEAGSIPATRSSAHVAQLVEHTLGKGEVGSSNLLMSSNTE